MTTKAEIMAHVHPVATTCEVTYDSDWYDDDRFMTPYRYSLLRNDTDSNSDTVSLTLPSYTYYEYLRSLYDCRSTALQRNPPGYPQRPSTGSDRIPERAKTWHEFGSERTSVQASREAAHSEPTKIRPTYPFPSLHLIQEEPQTVLPRTKSRIKPSAQGATSGDESEDEDYWDRSKEKLVWVDALNKWIPEHQLHPRPYISFVGNPPTVEKEGLPKSSRETPGGGDYFETPYCERFEQHMGRASVSQPSQPSRQRTSDKREEVRRRAQEIAEQRRQRKAYSTPLYTSLTERKLKARIRSSKAPASTPASPVQKTVKAPLPKEVWQPRDTPKITLEEKPAPIKKEISITLLTSKTEGVESKASGDVHSTPRDKGDKHVKFQQDQASKAGKDKKGKKKTEDAENENTNARSDSAAAERKLVEALEKQRQQQLAEEQRLLQEQQREKERLARERETQAEKERLEKERERLLELEKDPKKHGLMNSHKLPHENYYESTMNAAGYIQKIGSKSNMPEDNTKDRSEIPTVVIRNRNLNRGVLKPKEPVKATTPPNKTEKIEHRVNLARTKKTVDTVDSQKSVPGGTNYVPSKETKIKKDTGDKRKQVESSKKEVVVENKEPVIDQVLKENSLTDIGGKRRKGKGNVTKTPKKKGTKEKVKKKSEDEEEEKHQANKPLPNLAPLPEMEPPLPESPKQKEPLPVTDPISVSYEQTKTKAVNKKFKKGQKRVKGGQSKPAKPMLAGMSTTPKSLPAPSPAVKPSATEEKLLVSSADDLLEQPTEQFPKRQIQVKQQPGENNTPQKLDENELAYERRKSISQRVKEITLKEKKERPCVKKESKEKEETLPPPPDTKRVESWIFDDEDYSEKLDIKQEEEEEPAETVLPAITADLIPELIEEEKKQTKDKRRKNVIDRKIKTENKGKKWQKPKKLDSSYDDELRRQELAEERRKRQMEMLERLKGRQMEQFDGQEDDGSPHFEDYGFLSKYCIFTKGNIEMYRHAFDAVDDEHRGWLEGEEVMIALRGVNSKLTEAEEEYMYRILELTGYKLTSGADFKMFSVLAALSQRISALDSWMRNLIGKMNFKMLDMKLFMCKTLWECNVDPDTNKISLDQLCVDLRAGGVSLEHEFEVRQKLSHLDALDLLDFLTYVPLFIMIHESVVENPLDDTREK